MRRNYKNKVQATEVKTNNDTGKVKQEPLYDLVKYRRQRMK